MRTQDYVLGYFQAVPSGLLPSVRVYPGPSRPELLAAFPCLRDSSGSESTQDLTALNYFRPSLAQD